MSDTENISTARRALREETAREVAAHGAAVLHLCNWKDHGGQAPFGHLDRHHPTDRAGPLLYAATSLLSVLSAAYEDAAKLERQGEGESELLRYNRSLPGSLDAIQTLVGLAAYAIDAQFAIDGRG